MAAKRDWLGFWCSIGIGILFCGAALRWPDAGAGLMALGSAIIVVPLAYQRCGVGPSLGCGASVGFGVFALFWIVDSSHQLASEVLPLPNGSSNLRVSGINLVQAEQFGVQSGWIVPVLTYTNSGPIAAYSPQRGRSKADFSLSQGVLTKQETDRQMDYALEEVEAWTYSTSKRNQIPPGIASLPPPDGQIVWDIETYKSVQKGNLLVYAFIVMMWKDDLTPRGYIAISENCLYVDGSFQKLTMCEGAHNRTYLRKVKPAPR